MFADSEEQISLTEHEARILAAAYSESESALERWAEGAGIPDRSDLRHDAATLVRYVTVIREPGDNFAYPPGASQALHALLDFFQSEIDPEFAQILTACADSSYRLTEQQARHLAGLYADAGTLLDHCAKDVPVAHASTLAAQAAYWRDYPAVMRDDSVAEEYRPLVEGALHALVQYFEELSTQPPTWDAYLTELVSLYSAEIELLESAGFEHVGPRQSGGKAILYGTFADTVFMNAVNSDGALAGSATDAQPGTWNVGLYDPQTRDLVAQGEAPKYAHALQQALEQLASRQHSQQMRKSMTITLITAATLATVVLTAFAIRRMLRRRHRSLTELYASEIAHLANLDKDAAVTGTGGGFTALCARLDDARSLLATNSVDGSLLSARSPRKDRRRGWVVGIYDGGAYMASGSGKNVRAAVAAAFESLATGKAVGFAPEERESIESAFEPRNSDAIEP